MSKLGAIQKYAALVAGGKLTKVDDFKKAAVESFLFNVARYQQLCDARPMSKTGLDFDRAVGYLRSAGFQFSENQEATINKARYRAFDKKLHQEFSQLLMDMNAYLGQLQAKNMKG